MQPPTRIVRHSADPNSRSGVGVHTSIRPMSKRAAEPDTETAPGAPALRAAEPDAETASDDEVCVVVVRGEEADATVVFRVSKLLARNHGLADEWNDLGSLADIDPSKREAWRKLCRLSCASYDVEDPAAALAALDPEHPRLHSWFDRIVSNETRKLPLHRILMVYDIY